MTVEQTKTDREIRDISLEIANKQYSNVKDKFMKATRKQAKKLLDMELTDKEELMLGIAYKIGFADAVAICIDHGDQDESATEESGH